MFFAKLPLHTRQLNGRSRDNERSMPDESAKEEVAPRLYIYTVHYTNPDFFTAISPPCSPCR